MKHQDRLDYFIIATLAFVAVGSGLDLQADLAHGAAFSHIVKETVITLMATVVAVWLWLRLRRQQAEIRALDQALAESRQAAQRAEAWVQEAREQMSRVVSRQFEQWGLSESEQAIGWLMLKGFSLKEIALLRDTQEKTVRQQASSIYRKANLPGRHAFSGWFFEDWMSREENAEKPR